MRTTIKSIAIVLVVICCFATGVHAQKVSMTVADQHYASETGHYKMLMSALAIVYIVYRAVIYYRRREVKRFMGN